MHAKGWQGVGYDPSPLAGIGARELKLDIRQGYFTEATLRDGPWDVIISTEVIEHLEAPPAFLRLMRQAIADDGILLLTTPNADWITPALSSGELYALLAPGAHVVLQTAQSLKMALEAAGFAHVVVRAEEACLVAYASPVALHAGLRISPHGGRSIAAICGHAPRRLCRAAICRSALPGGGCSMR